MLEIGNFNILEVCKESKQGVYLASDQGDVFLSKKDVPEGTKIGDKLKVFVYHDKDTLVATTLIPKATVGEFAYLEVKDVNRYGAFLDLGIDKELMVPYNEQRQNIQMVKGQKYVVRLYLEKVKKRLTATTKIEKFIETECIQLYPGEEVQIMVYEFTDLGAKVIVEDKYLGLVYKSDIYQDLKIGDQITGYVLKIRDDHKLDISIRQRGRKKTEEGKDLVMAELERRGGFLPLTDHSSPEEIKNMLQMSKNSFKQAVGGLYKERKILLTEEGIELVQEIPVKS